MPRIARIVVPGLPHHVVQRGYRRQQTFFCDEDKRTYLHLLQKQGEEEGVKFQAYCLMDNHVHLVAVPERSDSLAKGIGQSNWKYAMIINLRHGWKGYLWQCRFASYPLDEAYFYTAVRYTELNPVWAGIVSQADDYPWSSARAHVLKIPDPILSDNLLAEVVPDWKAFLAAGLSPAEIKLIHKHEMSGRPLGSECFIDRLEKLTGRILREKKRGRKANKTGKRAN
ncbi:MAG: transposase [Acidobacteriota bacterium]